MARKKSTFTEKLRQLKDSVLGQEKEPEPTPPPEPQIDEDFEEVEEWEEEEKEEVEDFLEIGGSPVPGLTLRQVLRGHKSWICRIAWSPDGTYLASPSDDKTIRIWEMASGMCVLALQGHTAPVASVAWSPDSTRLASADDDHTIRLWDAATGKHVPHPGRPFRYG